MIARFGIFVGGILLLVVGFIGGALTGMEMAYGSQDALGEVDRNYLRDAVAAVAPTGTNGAEASARMTALGFSCRREIAWDKSEYIGCGRTLQRSLLFSSTWVANYQLGPDGRVVGSTTNFAHTGL
jgi:hypothetical protein